MSSVTIYTTPTCVYCRMAKEYFKENNIIYTERDVQADAAAREEMVQKSGQMGVPVIELDHKIIVGFDKGALDEALGINQ